MIDFYWLFYTILRHDIYIPIGWRALSLRLYHHHHHLSVPFLNLWDSWIISGICFVRSGLDIVSALAILLYGVLYDHIQGLA